MKKTLSVLLVPLFLFLQITPAVAEDQADVRDEIIYNILVDRYNNGEQSRNEQTRIDDPYAYHGGDLKGIIKKLDEIQGLGFTAITLSPIMANAPDGYHGYWIQDFYEVEDQFGTMEDVQTLVDEAHRRDMKVILEFVTNYVSDTHEIAEDPDKSDWLKDNNTKASGAAFWLDDTVMLDQDNPEVAELLTDAANFWMTETDIDGFKLHAADQASPEFLKKLADEIKGTNPDFYLLADVFQDMDKAEALRDIPGIDAVDNGQLQNEMNDVFAEADNPVLPLIKAWQDKAHNGVLLSVDNKNTKRFSQRVAEQGRKPSTVWELALTYMYTTPGIPSIYQGTEIPMFGEGFPENQKLVQFNSGEQDLPEFLGRIAALRSEFPALVYGDFEEVGSNEGMSVFKRTYGDETLYVAINNDSELRTVTVTGIDADKQLSGLLGDNLVRETKDGTFKIGIPRETAEVFVLEENKGINWLFIGFIISVFIVFVGAVVYLSRKQKRDAAAEQ